MQSYDAIGDQQSIDGEGQYHEAREPATEEMSFRNIMPSPDPISEQVNVTLGLVLHALDQGNKRPFDGRSLEEAPPPPYSPPVAAAEGKKSFSRRRILFIAATLLFLIIVLLAILLARFDRDTKSSSSPVASTSGTSAGVSSSSSPHAPTSTSAKPSKSSPVPFSLPSASPIPSNLPKSGNASAPRLNTAIDSVSILNTGTISGVLNQTILMKIFFQDDENYLCEKSSDSGFDSWGLGDSGNRIMEITSGSPIAAVVYPDQTLPIRVFFVNIYGFLADIIQEEYGGTWTNGNLSQQQFLPFLVVGDVALGVRANCLDASWCDGQGPVVYVQGTDAELVAFQLSNSKDNHTWSTVPGSHGGNQGYGYDSINFASVCMFDDQGIAPVFVNRFESNRDLGWLNLFSGENTDETVDLPPPDVLLFRPNTPISAVFGNFDPTTPSSSVNMSLYLFYSLPQSLDSLTPNPSLHMVYASPYQPPLVAWTDESGSVSTDLGIVPYALGGNAIYDLEAAQGQDFNYIASVGGAMPRAWSTLRVGGGSDAGTIVVVYQTENGTGIQVADVLGGTMGIWDIIAPQS